MNEQKLILADLASGLSHRASLPMRYSEDFVRSFFKVIEDGLMRDQLVKVKGFGTFKLIGIEARESINVSTGERFEIAGHTKVSFTPDSALRDAVNRPFVEFDTVILNEGTDTALMEATDDEVLSETVAEVQAETQEPAAEKISQFVEQPSLEEVGETPVQEEAVEEPVVEVPDVEEPVEEETVDEPVQEDVVDTVEDEVQDEPEDDEDENNEEPIQEETEMKDQFDTMPESNGHSALRMILGALLFTAIGYCLGYYWHPIALPELCCEKVESAAPAASPAAEPAQSDEAIPADSIVATSDSTATAEPVAATAAADYPQLEGGEYLIVGVLANDTMKVGKMLTKMAIQYYGDKDLYKYICTMNNIENPDVVPLNMPLLIPKLEKKQE